MHNFEISPNTPDKDLDTLQMELEDELLNEPISDRRRQEVTRKLGYISFEIEARRQ